MTGSGSHGRGPALEQRRDDLIEGSGSVGSLHRLHYRVHRPKVLRSRHRDASSGSGHECGRRDRRGVCDAWAGEGLDSWRLRGPRSALARAARVGPTDVGEGDRGAHQPPPALPRADPARGEGRGARALEARRRRRLRARPAAGRDHRGRDPRRGRRPAHHADGRARPLRGPLRAAGGLGRRVRGDGQAARRATRSPSSSTGPGSATPRSRRRDAGTHAEPRRPERAAAAQRRPAARRGREPAVRRLVELDRAAVGGDEPLHDGEAEAGAAVAVRAGRAPEAVEGPGPLLGAHPRARVARRHELDPVGGAVGR